MEVTSWKENESNKEHVVADQKVFVGINLFDTTKKLSLSWAGRVELHFSGNFFTHFGKD